MAAAAFQGVADQAEIPGFGLILLGVFLVGLGG